jgi:hypothetical protein
MNPIAVKVKIGQVWRRDDFEFRVLGVQNGLVAYSVDKPKTDVDPVGWWPWHNSYPLYDWHNQFEFVSEPKEETE